MSLTNEEADKIRELLLAFLDYIESECPGVVTKRAQEQLSEIQGVFDNASLRRNDERRD